MGYGLFRRMARRDLAELIMCLRMGGLGIEQAEEIRFRSICVPQRALVASFRQEALSRTANLAVVARLPATKIEHSAPSRDRDSCGSTVKSR